MFTTVKDTAVSEFTEKKSRFISTISPVADEGMAKAFISRVKALYPDSRHNCFAYRLHTPFVERFSDDGEPAGTAGMPILGVLKTNALFNVCVVVTRYFGGVLLGAGGLCRAYSRGASDVVLAAQKVVYKPACFLQINLPYTALDAFTNSLNHKPGLKILGIEYTDKVSISISLEAGLKDEVLKLLMDLTRGKGLVTAITPGFDTF